MSFVRVISRGARTQASTIFTVLVVFAVQTIILTASAQAACTVGGAAVDGIAPGSLVNCPTGAVQAGTAPPDGSTINSKNVNAGPPATTTFHYTNPPGAGGGAGSVQLLGTVTLSATTASASEAGQAAAANNAAMVDALFGGGSGGNGGAMINGVEVFATDIAGPTGNPVVVQVRDDLRDAQRELEKDVSLITAIENAIERTNARAREQIAKSRKRITEAQEELDELVSSNPQPNITVQLEIDRLEQRSMVTRT